VGVLRINGALSSDPMEIKDHIVNYYDSLYIEQSRGGLGWMKFLCPPLMQMSVFG
jgi:hypothetical protein